MRPASTTLVAIVLLAAWLGATLCVTLLVAPAAFTVLPTRTLAGALVGRVLPALFAFGIVLGLGVAVLGWTSGADRAWRIGPAVAAAAACAIAQLVIAGRIGAIRAAVGGPIDALAMTDPRRVAFGRLHGMSVACLGLAMLCVLVTLAAYLRLATRSPA